MVHSSLILTGLVCLLLVFFIQSFYFALPCCIFSFNGKIVVFSYSLPYIPAEQGWPVGWLTTPLWSTRKMKINALKWKKDSDPEKDVRIENFCYIKLKYLLIFIQQLIINKIFAKSHPLSKSSRFAALNSLKTQTSENRSPYILVHAAQPMLPILFLPSLWRTVTGHFILHHLSQ